MPDSSPQNGINKKSLFHYAVHTEILIEASAEQVWSILMDPSELVKWSTSFQGMRGEIKKGGLVVVDFMVKGRLLKQKHALTDCVEQRLFSWSDPIVPGLRDNHQYLIEPVSDQQVRFVQTDEVKGPLALLLGAFTSRLLLELYLDFNTRLKACAEKA